MRFNQVINAMPRDALKINSGLQWIQFFGTDVIKVIFDGQFQIARLIFTNFLVIFEDPKFIVMGRMSS